MPVKQETVSLVGE